MKEAGELAWREEQGRRGVDLDQVALEVPWGLQEAFGNEAGGVCGHSQTLKWLKRRNGMVLVSTGAFGCKHSELLWANLSKKGY